MSGVPCMFRIMASGLVRGPSAWQVSAASRGLPANWLTCGTVGHLSASDRALPL